jgi:hypothetical protein
MLRLPTTRTVWAVVIGMGSFATGAGARPAKRTTARFAKTASIAGVGFAAD